MPQSKDVIATARRLRRELSPPEARLWTELRGRKLADLRFRRQHPVGPYVLDFYCVSARLAVEVDGRAHDEPDRIRQDQRRDAWLAEQGIRVLRVTAREVKDNLDGVAALIQQKAGLQRSASVAAPRRQTPPASAQPPPPLRGPPPPPKSGGGQAHSGILSCFFHGLVSTFPSRVRSALMIRRLVPCGMITSSI